MRLIDADALFVDASFFNDELDRAERFYSEEQIKNAPTIDAVKVTMPWTDPDGTERMLDEVSYEIGYAQGQRGKAGYWVRFHGDHICMGLRPKWDCCSECGMVGTPTRFCSNCGARMAVNHETD